MALFFATASLGTADVLGGELGRMGIRTVEPQRTGVRFGDAPVDGYLACLWSRVASRVLLPLTSFEVDDADGLYEAVHAIDWAAHLGPERTLAIEAAGGRSPAGPPHYAALKTKDAIVDRIRARTGSRPDVDTKNPDVRVHLHLDGPHTTVSIDLAGRGLHRRGIGRTGAEAPLKENLAAAILEIAAWPERAADSPLFDPMCGSGTLLVEAAWIALDVAPGLARKRIGAEGWRGHDPELWKRLRAEADERRRTARDRVVRIAGSDASVDAIRSARRNAARAGLGNRIRLERRELGDVTPPWQDAGTVVTNPPYGERLGETGELGVLYETLGDVLKRRFPGWSAWILSGNPALAKQIGLRPRSRRVLYNGPIEARLLEIPIAETPLASERGPRWRRASADAKPFENRLRKNKKRLAPWADRNGLTCYRLYDADVPEYNVAVDWYDGAVRVEEYARPGKIPDEVATKRLRDAVRVVEEVLSVDRADIVVRVRSRRPEGTQHERRDRRERLREVQEGDLRFLVNLTDYLDTGLFLDDRLLRARIRGTARGRSFLNLFAYTCTASVAAAAGGARDTTSVDLSSRYLEWGKRNFSTNGIPERGHRFVRADVLRWIGVRGRERFGLVFLAPPTWSRSKAMRGDFDVGRDHGRLIRRASELLAPDGEILFATNARTFDLDEAAISPLEAVEITEAITPEDFRRRPRLRAWSIRRPRQGDSPR